MQEHIFRQTAFPFSPLRFEDFRSVYSTQKAPNLTHQLTSACEHRQLPRELYMHRHVAPDSSPDQLPVSSKVDSARDRIPAAVSSLNQIVDPVESYRTAVNRSQPNVLK
jgi:hypothetical protein